MTLDDLRGLKDRLIGELPAQRDKARQYVRGSMELAWFDLTGEGAPPLTDEPLLHVRLLDQDTVSAPVAGALATQIQDATARLVKVALNRDASPARVYPADRDRAGLIQRLVFGNEITFAFSPTPSVEGGLDLGVRDVTRSELAARKLVSSLPSGPQDVDALDAILGASTAVRLAVRDLVEATTQTGAAVGMELTGVESDPGEMADLSGLLTRQQAEELKTVFDEIRELKETLTITGRLDGERIRRRIFYLEQDDGTEISGAIDEDQVYNVRNNLDRRVEVTLHVTQTVSKAGQRGRKHYRLTDLQIPPHLPFDGTD